MQRPPNARTMGLSLAAACLFLLPVLNPFHPVRAAAQESPARLFTAHALALRTAGVAGNDAAAAVLASMPGAAAVSESLPVLFQSFFVNAIVQLGRLDSPRTGSAVLQPAARSRAVHAVGEAGGEPWRQRGSLSAGRAPGRPKGRRAGPAGVDARRRQPGCRADGHHDRAPCSLSPPSPLAVIRGRARHGYLRGRRPGPAGGAASAGVERGADDPLDRCGETVAALCGGAHRGALAARSPGALTAAAPDTDAQTAAALARLPRGFAAGLTLDMVIEASNVDRLLIASLPEDGDVYVLVLCRLGGGTCALRRLLLMSLSTGE